MGTLISYSVAVKGFVIGLTIGAGLVLLSDRRRSSFQQRWRK